MRLTVLILACATSVFAQGVPVSPLPGDYPETCKCSPPAPNLWRTLTDPSNVSMASYVLSNVADSTTDWKFSALGKQYSVSPLQRTMFVGGTIGAAIAVGHYVPKSRKWVTLGLTVGSSILAGRAYAHTLVHGTPAVTPATPAASPQMTFAVRR